MPLEPTVTLPLPEPGVAVNAEPVPLMVTEPNMPEVLPTIRLLAATWPPLVTVIAPMPVSPTVRLFVTVHVEPAPLTVAVPSTPTF